MYVELCAHLSTKIMLALWPCQSATEMVSFEPDFLPHPSELICTVLGSDLLTGAIQSAPERCQAEQLGRLGEGH